MDLKSGYYEIEEECCKEKNSFFSFLGVETYATDNGIGFHGMTNVPGTFQHLIEKRMGDINLQEVLVFLDNLTVFSKTFEEDKSLLNNVLN